MKTITIEVDDTVHALLEVLGRTGVPDDHPVEHVVLRLIDHAQQGVYRPGAWEREWLIQAFGDDWIAELEPGDPYGRPDLVQAEYAKVFQRPKGWKP